MSVDVHKWIEPFPERLKKKGLRIHLSGNQHLSSNVVPQSIQEKQYGQRGVNDIAVLIASVMSLWWNSEKQNHFKYTQKSAEVADLRMKTATTPTSPCTIRTQKGHGFKDKDLINLAKQYWKVRKTTHLPVNISGEKVQGLVGIKRDFRKEYGTKIGNIFTDANTIDATVFIVNLLQNCSDQARDLLGNCKTVVKSTNQEQEVTSSVQVITNDCQNSIPGLLPIVSSVIQANNLCVLLIVQAHAIKVAIACVITARLFLLKNFLKQCEFLDGQGQFKVNQTISKSDISSANCAEKAKIKDENTSVSVNSVHSTVFSTANREAINFSAFAGGLGAGDIGMAGEDNFFWGDEDHDEEAGLREVPQVPNFRHYLDDDMNDVNEDMDRRLRGDGRMVWNEDYDMAHLPQDLARVVPVALENGEAKHPIDDEFANQLIYDPQEFVAFGGGGIAAEQPLPDDQEMDLFLNEEWLEFEDEDPRADAA